ncbi:MAG TPA: stage V sporulation T C-terminal domain-containing protein, partial [Massilibacterium sp.]|nr:stage V sporulation T C-terminal domain-containing protein [Massilibacterium sp.]
ETTIDARQVKRESEQTEVELIDGMKEQVTGFVIAPIIAGGDPIGAVVIYSIDDTPVEETEQMVAETAASFLGKQMED